MLTDFFVSLDLEMTSARPEQQEIIEIAAVKFKGDRVVGNFATLVNPGQAVPYPIQVLTGISQSVVDRAPSLHEVAGDLVAFVGDLPLVAHSIASDIGCLERKGIALFNRQIDTFELATILLPQMPNYSLSALAAHFGIPITSQHRAAGDALMTGKVFRILVTRAMELDLPILQEINRLAKGMDWQLGGLFMEIEREMARNAFAGSTIREKLAAKGGLEEAAFDFMYMGRQKRKPLVPRPRQEIDAEEIVSAFGPGGGLASTIEGYEHRPQQEAMARAVCEALNEGRQLVVEAGTGTGKSMAYLLPAAHFAAKNNERVIISTNTINLQDQLFDKDIPTSQRVTKIPFKAAVIKGRANYLCQLRFAGMRRHHDLSPDEVRTLIKVLVWLPTTKTGDVAELNLIEGQRLVWSKLYAPAESCAGNQCLYFKKGSCFVYRARDEAERSHIVVVNHSLLLSDMLVSSKVLPEYSFLVIDEAHHFEDEATNQLGCRLSQRDILEYLDGLSQPIAGERRSGLLSELKVHLRGAAVPQPVERELDAITKGLHATVDEAREAAKDLGRSLIQFMKANAQDNRGYDPRVRLTASIRARGEWSEVEEAWERCALRLRSVQEGVDKITTLIERHAEGSSVEYEALMATLATHLHANVDLRAKGTTVIGRPEEGMVCWLALSNHSGGDLSLHAAPLHVGEALDQHLFSTKEGIVLTSATMSAGGDFRYLKERLGLTGCATMQVNSPFDYARSTLLFVPTDIPEPERPNYQRSVAQAVIALCKATGGRALVLFTSYNQLGQTLKEVRPVLEDERILVLAQEPGGRGPSRRQLLESFRKNERAVLLGAASFWEGIDVVGEALSLLIIARLPFAVPSDPIVAARSEQYEDPFREYSLPQMILRFKQGFGRLIRSKSDRGAVVVLDRRIQTKSYGQLILNSLPGCTRRFGPLNAAAADIPRWLGGNVRRED